MCQDSWNWYPASLSSQAKDGMKCSLFGMLCSVRYCGCCVVSQGVISCSHGEGKLVARCEHKANECGVSSSSPAALLVSPKSQTRCLWQDSGCQGTKPSSARDAHVSRALLSARGLALTQLLLSQPCRGLMPSQCPRSGLAWSSHR